MKQFCVLLLVVISFHARAQFDELDQLYPFVNPTVYNPANTAHFIDETSYNYTTARIQSNTSIHNINRFPWVRTNLSGEGRLPVGRKDFVGIGGDYDYWRSLEGFSDGQLLHVRVSYQKELGGRRHPSSILSAGIGAGINHSKVIDPSNRSWGYRQQHGLTFTHQKTKYFSKSFVYQIGISHSMHRPIIQYLNDTIYSQGGDWVHLAGLQAYGEWTVAERVQFNVVLNYNHWFIDLPFPIARHAMGATIGASFDLSEKRHTGKLILGFGTHLIGWVENGKLARMTWNGFVGFEYQCFRVMVRVSSHNNNNSGINLYNYGSYLLHHAGISLAYHGKQKRHIGGVPVF